MRTRAADHLRTAVIQVLEAVATVVREITIMITNICVELCPLQSMFPYIILLASVEKTVFPLDAKHPMAIDPFIRSFIHSLTDKHLLSSLLGNHISQGTPKKWNL